MKEYWSTRIRDMVPYTPGEQPKGRTFIKLNTNENPYPPSPKVLEAIQAAAGGALWAETGAGLCGQWLR